MITQSHAGAGTARSFLAPLLAGVSLVAPFAVLQWVNRRASLDAFPVVLFIFMSVHALCIALLVTPAVRRLQADRRLGALTPGLWAGLLTGAFLACSFGAIVVDQLPCFLGVPNCD